MDPKLQFEQLISSSQYNFDSCLSILTSLNATETEQAFKFIFGPGRNPDYILKIKNFNQLKQLFDFILCQKISPTPLDVKTALQVQIDKKIIHDLATHSGKFINSSSASKYVKIPTNLQSILYQNSNAQSTQRYMVYAGTAGFQKFRFFFESCFYYDNQLTGFYELLAISHPALITIAQEYGVVNEITKLQSQIHNKNSSLVDDLPQTFFPVSIQEKKYVLLSALPSFRMLNAIKYGSDTFYNNHRSEKDNKFTHRLPKNSLKVGGTQPQNVSSFNSDNAGTYYLFDNLPPQPKTPSYKLNDKIFFYSSLINDYATKISLISHYKDLSNEKKKEFLSPIIENFLTDKLKLTVSLKEEAKDFNTKIEESRFHIQEKNYLLEGNITSDLVEYYFNKLRFLFQQNIIKYNEIEQHEIDFIMVFYKQIAKRMIRSIL